MAKPLAPLAQRTAPVELRAVQSSAAVRAAYQRRLDAVIDEMHRSLVYWLKGAYRANPPAIALDASPARELRAAIRKLRRRWLANFDTLAPKLATYFATAARTVPLSQQPAAR